MKAVFLTLIMIVVILGIAYVAGFRFCSYLMENYIHMSMPELNK